jgi:hypothetical protein
MPDVLHKVLRNTVPIVLLLITLALSGCGGDDKKETITDRAGVSVALPGQINTIISTAP